MVGIKDILDVKAILNAKKVPLYGRQIHPVDLIAVNRAKLRLGTLDTAKQVSLEDL